MRYFLEVSYKGTNYAGFQVQRNANTIQAEVEKALLTLMPSLALSEGRKWLLTGSSRTDAGVHALQNFFHFDCEEEISSKALYNLNALLPQDIAIRSVSKTDPQAHCRFDALSREYRYYIHKRKNPFTQETSWLYPYKLDVEALQHAAALLLKHDDFTSFSKKKAQNKTNNCTIMQSEWEIGDEQQLVYHVKANRFLRGMVKGLVSTMLLAGRHKISLNDFESIILAKDAGKANFVAPSRGLFLIAVEYPAGLLSS